MTNAIATIDRDGRLDVAADAVLPIYSLTKTFIAAAIVALKIDLREPISTWIDRDWAPRGPDITVTAIWAGGRASAPPASSSAPAAAPSAC